MKKYFVVADVHSFYDEMIAALKEKGYDGANPEHVFVSLGDLFDRGTSPLECLRFVNAISSERKILIRGNHEYLLFGCLVREFFLDRDLSNGTADTVYRLAGETGRALAERNERFLFTAVREDPEVKKYFADLRDYAEIGDCVFVHGWIPTRSKAPKGDWRRGDWWEARWFNGMEKWKHGSRVPDKTILCGHWHASWGHAFIEKKGTEFGETADFSPFIASGIISLDACTPRSHKVNCIVLEI